MGCRYSTCKYSSLFFSLLPRKAQPAAILAAGLLAASMLLTSAAAQTKTTSSLAVSGSQPYNLTCNVSGLKTPSVAGPSGTVNFTDMTTATSLGSASLGAPWPGYPLPQSTYPVGLNVSALATGDMNGDGNLDVVAAGVVNSLSISVLLGTGSGTFQPPVVTSFPAGQDWVGNLAVGDFDRDGKQDAVLIVGSDKEDDLYFLKGLGNGPFSPRSR